MAVAGEADAGDWRPTLDEELQRLPEKYRLPLVLCYLQGKTNAEAAAELGWPAGSMSRRLARAWELLREGLVRRGIGLPAALLGVAAAGELEAAVPASLLAVTVRAAVAFEGGQVAVEVSAGARVLAQAYLTGISMTKIKVLAGVILLAALAAGGTLAQRVDHGREQQMNPLTLLALAGNTDSAPKDSPASPSLVGSWRVVSLRIEGQHVPPDLAKQLHLTFTKKDLTFRPRYTGERDARGKWNLRIDGPDGETWPYRLGADGAGTTLAYTWKHEAAGTGVATYHYRFVKDRLELCQDRPLELFSGKHGMMWILERLPAQAEKQSKKQGGSELMSESRPASDRESVPQAKDRKEPASARLRPGDIPIGALGHPLGAYLTIEGIREHGIKTGNQTLRVDTINGKKLQEPIGIWVENIRDLPPDVRIKLKGYETGEMDGPIPAAIKAAEEKGEEVLAPQRGWQWNAYFVALSSVHPKLTIEERKTGFKTVKPGQNPTPPREKRN